MSIVNHRTIYAATFYVLIVMLFVVAKPKFAFGDDGSIRAFGIGQNKSIVSLGVLSSVLAILSFYAFTIIDIVFRNG